MKITSRVFYPSNGLPMPPSAPPIPTAIVVTLNGDEFNAAIIEYLEKHDMMCSGKGPLIINQNVAVNGIDVIVPSESWVTVKREV